MDSPVGAAPQMALNKQLPVIEGKQMRENGSQVAILEQLLDNGTVRC